jgi:tetratricopeptide (TPR) repeat protein
VVPPPVAPPPVAPLPIAPAPPEPPPAVETGQIEVEPPPEAPRPTGTRVRPGLARAQGRAMLKSAQTLLKAQRYEEAEEAFKRALGGRRERGMALVGLGNIAFQKQNYAEAETRAREARTANGGSEAALLLGDAYFKQGKYADAKAAYDDALRMNGGGETAKKRARAGSDLAARRM